MNGSCVFGDSRPLPRLRGRICRFLGIAVCLAALSSACGGGAGENRAAPATQTGPFPVGNASFILEDVARPMGCGAGHRRLVTEVWYPAAEEAVGWPENFVSDFMLNQEEAARERFGEESLTDLPTGSFRDAPLHPGAAAMPILIFSHGFSSNRFQNFTMANHLASRGFLVVAPDHTCNAMIAPLPDGPVFFSFADIPFSLWERIADIRFLIEVFSARPPEMFECRLDTERIGLWGHSFGGITAIETVKVEPRVSAMLQLAAFGFPGVPADLDLPSMYMWGEQDKMMGPFVSLHDGIIDAMPTPKYVLNFFDTGHFAFSDLCRFAAVIAEFGDGCGSGTRIGTGEPYENPDHETLHAILNPYAAAFFLSAFYRNAESVAYLKQNHSPDRIEYDPLFESSFTCPDQP